MSHSSLVSIRDLRVELGGKCILEGVNAEVQRGKITALIGLNGSGKTTLLRAILKECPSRGQIQFHCGHNHEHHRPEHVGYVPQKLTIDARLPLTVRELFALTLQRRPIFFGVAKGVSERAAKLLARVNAGHLLDRSVATLSGGEMQRVLLSLALDPHPEFLLLDEPAAGIDFADQVPFYAMLNDINRETGLTILLVSHDLSVVSEHAHHVLCLKNGRVECEGPPSEVLSGDMLMRTFGSEKKFYHHHHH